MHCSSACLHNLSNRNWLATLHLFCFASLGSIKMFQLSAALFTFLQTCRKCRSSGAASNLYVQGRLSTKQRWTEAPRSRLVLSALEGPRCHALGCSVKGCALTTHRNQTPVIAYLHDVHNGSPSTEGIAIHSSQQTLRQRLEQLLRVLHENIISD